MLQNVADGIVTIDEGGLIESFNRSAQRLFGYAEQEVIGQPLGLILAPEVDAGSRGEPDPPFTPRQAQTTRPRRS